MNFINEHPYMSYALIGIFYGLLNVREFLPNQMRIRAENYVKGAKRFEEIQNRFTGDFTAHAMFFLLAVIWPIWILVWFYFRLYRLVFGHEPIEFTELE